MDKFSDFKTFLEEILMNEGKNIHIQNKATLMEANHSYRQILVDLIFRRNTPKESIDRIYKRSNSLLEGYLKEQEVPLFAVGSQELLVTNSVKNPGMYQITFFDSKGAIMDMQRESIKEVLEELIRVRAIPLPEKYAEYVVEKENFIMKKEARFTFREAYGESEKIKLTPESPGEILVEWEDGGFSTADGDFEDVSKNIHLVREILEDEGFEVSHLAEVDEGRETFKEELMELLEEDELMANGDEYEVIYEIDDIVVYGGFEGGIRGVDHNVLLSDEVDWEDVINWGTIVVPETMSYISDEPIEEYEDLGYQNLPINNNHIMGWENNTISNDYEMEM